MRLPSTCLNPSTSRGLTGVGRALALSGLIAIIVAGCGEPTVEAAPTDLSSGDTTGGDSSLSDCCDDDAGGAGDTGSTWHEGPDAGVAFTGQGQIEVEGDKISYDMRKLKLTMFLTTQPEKGKVYVWWMRSPSKKSKNFGTLPHEDTPYVADFLIEVPDAGDGSPAHIANFNGAYVTYEEELGAETLDNPVGPVVWKGEIPLSAWVHVQHVLTRRDGAGDLPGYIQQAAEIMSVVQAQLKKLRDAMIGGKPKQAVVFAENIHTLLVGVDGAVDLTGDNDFAKDLSAFTMGLAAGVTPLNGAVKHAKIAKDAAEDAGGATNGLTQGYAALEDATKGFNKGMTPALEALKAFAAGTTKDIKAVDATLNQLTSRFSAAMIGARKLGQIDLKR